MIEFRIDTNDDRFEVLCDKPTKQEMNFVTQIGTLWNDWYIGKKPVEVKLESPLKLKFKIGDLVRQKENKVAGEIENIRETPFGFEFKIKNYDQWAIASQFELCTPTQETD